jgi:tRNA nucleotidyltransferase (CCA-adding enzyme)
MLKRFKKIDKYFGHLITNISNLAKERDVKAYIVGGVVRDLLLDRKIFDLDIVIEGDAIAFAQELSRLYKKEFKKHHNFGTATVYFGKHHIDFATARKETYQHCGALPKVKPAGLKEDLARRDFTINAMALRLNKNNYLELVDFYGGLSDLRKSLIRVLHKQSFFDDPTRILRAIRFEQRFLFKIENITLRTMKSALAKNALNFVNSHRLRDELVSILKEPRPYRYIKRIQQLGDLSFLSKDLRLKHSDYKFLKRIEKALSFYYKRYKKHRKLDEWLLYLFAIVLKLSHKKLLGFLNAFGIRKGDRIRLLSTYHNLKKMNQLKVKVTPSIIYKILSPLSYETILFFYAYSQDQNIKKNIKYFFDKLCHLRLKLKGQDLKELGFKPYNLYSRLLEELLYIKIDKGLETKEQELEYVRKIFTSLKVSH